MPNHVVNLPPVKGEALRPYNVKLTKPATNREGKPHMEAHVTVQDWGSFEMWVPVTKGGKITKAGKDMLNARVDSMAH